MINLFIDTNAYLDFYHLSNDDLEELNKLKVAIEQNRINLMITDQVIDEFNRNREGKIADTIKLLEGLKLGLSFPRLIQSYPEYELMRNEARNFGEHLATARAKLAHDIAAKSLGPDSLIKELFDSAQTIALTDALLQRAIKRQTLRKPPGKNDNSIGDAINWESLLESVPNGEDLYIVSVDGDFSSKVDKDCLKDYLADEWNRTKNSSSKLYKSLGAFFGEHYPGIKLADELKRNMLIQDLIQSGNFVSTHRYVAKLGMFDEFSDKEARDIFDAAQNNSQIYWLGQDSDVNTFIRRLIAAKQSILEDTERQNLDSLFPEPEPEIPDFDDLPF